MIFNSYVFIFAFLPVVIFVFYSLGRYSHHLATLWLTAASLFFYGWWDARFLGLLLSSILVNYGAGYLIGHSLARSRHHAKLVLITSIIANLGLLGYFKYANFFMDNLNFLSANFLSGSAFNIAKIFLPLGISFFTFTQLAFLVDTYQGKVKEYNFVHYTLFVTYFPHLIAGPVLHHKEMMPQFAKQDNCRVNWDNIAIGLTIFIWGLAKKVLLADSLGEYATPIFEAVKAAPLRIVVNTAVPRPWRQANNDLINEIAGLYPNTIVIRWDQISEGHPEYFAPDGIHLVPAGARAYVAAITSHL